MADKTPKLSPLARQAARDAADKAVLAEIRQETETRQAKSAALREARLARDAEATPKKTRRRAARAG
jgi:hypothetical protein